MLVYKDFAECFCLRLKLVLSAFEMGVWRFVSLLSGFDIGI